MVRLPLDDYAPTCAALLQQAPPMELGPGSPPPTARRQLATIDHAALFAGRPLVDADMADCCLAGLWLRYDFLDESHRISQSIESASGSFWHGVMHRREGDYSNAKYWFRRVGDHPIFEPLGAAARRLAASATGRAARQFADQPGWDPFGFVELVEGAIRRHADDRPLCIQIALAEWELLFDYCYRSACGEQPA